jgi:hypothetical protein
MEVWKYGKVGGKYSTFHFFNLPLFQSSNSSVYIKLEIDKIPFMGYASKIGERLGFETNHITASSSRTLS